MRKVLIIAVLAAAVIALGTMSYADDMAKPVQAVVTTQVTTSQPVVAKTTTKAEGFGGKLKLEGYGEFISFRGGDINHNTWGGGILARYLFVDWFGAQTNVSFYSKCKTNAFDGDLSLTNWRLTLLLHAYAKDIDPKLYGYAGAGLGVQFNNDISGVRIDDGLTGHVLLGIGYDINEIINVEAEVGYQFGSADVKDYTTDNIGLEALFVRFGAGVRF